MANRGGLPDDHPFRDRACPLALRLGREHCAPDFVLDAADNRQEVTGTGCPFPACIYRGDEDHRARAGERSERQAVVQLARGERDRAVLVLLATGLPGRQIVERTGASLRTVRRIKAGVTSRPVQLAGRTNGEILSTYRAYKYRCLCGHWNEGRYPIADLKPKEQAPAIDKGKIVCFGCGKSLAENDRTVALARLPLLPKTA